MDYDFWNAAGITLLAAFGLWAFYYGMNSQTKKSARNDKDKRV